MAENGVILGGGSAMGQVPLGTSTGHMMHGVGIYTMDSSDVWVAAVAIALGPIHIYIYIYIYINTSLTDGYQHISVESTMHYPFAQLR